MTAIHLPRFTTQRLMAAVAVVGLLLGTGVELRKRRIRFTSLAAEHARIAKSIRFLGYRTDLAGVKVTHGSQFGRHRRSLGRASATETDEAESANKRKAWAEQAAFHERLKLKYEDAARRPWLPVLADPPPPK